MLRFFVLLIFFLLPQFASGSTVLELQTALKQEQYTHAVKTGLFLLNKHPDNIQIKFLTAIALQKNQQFNKAQDFYQQIIQSQPEIPEPRNNLALIYMQQGKHDEAINMLISSLKTHPSYATAWQNLNKLYRGIASETYRKAFSKDKNPKSVLGKIQLAALNELHLPAKTLATKIIEDKAAEPPILVAETEKTVNNKPAKARPEVLILALKNWAAAWESKQFKTYINAYVPNYKDDKASHTQWVEHRQTRIIRPGNITVKLSQFNIQGSTSNRAVIDFKQKFISPNYRDSVLKRIILTKMGSDWKILRESTISVL